jgi:hypothetical protein
VSKRRASAVVIGCAMVALVTAGCVDDAESFANDDATSTADTITRYLQSDVVTPGLSAAEQLAKVRRWLAAPSQDYTRSYTEPDLRILTTTGQRIDIVVYEYGRPAPMGGTKRAWGIACRRYTVDATSQLHAESIACPSGLSRNPNR